MPTAFCHRHHWDSLTKVSSSLWIDWLPVISLLGSQCLCVSEQGASKQKEEKASEDIWRICRFFKSRMGRKIHIFKSALLKYHLPTYKHTNTHGGGQMFCATISKTSNLSTHSPHTKTKTHTPRHLHRKLTVKRSRHLSGCFTRRRASEGRNKCSHLKSSLMARGENGNLIYMLYFISLFQIWRWLSGPKQQYTRVQCHICVCWFPVTWQAVGARGIKNKKTKHQCHPVYSYSSMRSMTYGKHV